MRHCLKDQRANPTIRQNCRHGLGRVGLETTGSEQISLENLGQPGNNENREIGLFRQGDVQFALGKPKPAREFVVWNDTVAHFVRDNYNPCRGV